MSKKEEFPIDVKIDFDGGVGEIDTDAFKANLPEGLVEEHFQKVDDFRDQFAAAVAEKVLDVAADHFANNENDLSVVDYGIGGNTTLSMVMGSDYQLVTSISTSTGEALDAVNQKAKEMALTNMAEAE